MSKDLRNTLIAAALFIAIACGLGYKVSDTSSDLEQVTKDNQALEDEIKQNNDYIKRAPKLQQQLNELNANFRDYVKILPSAEVATEEKLLRTVQGYAEGAQVRMEELTTRQAAGKKGGGKMGEFEEVSVDFRITCDFDSFVRFLNLLERHEQFMKVNSFSVTPSPTPRIVDGKEVIDLAVNIQVSTYKYIPTKK